jgi:hypothetical protein
VYIQHLIIDVCEMVGGFKHFPLHSDMLNVFKDSQAIVKEVLKTIQDYVDFK